MTGKFISIEGLEGAGKSTQALALVEWLERKHVEVVRTREPGGTPIAESIRELVLAHHSEKMDSTTELLLVFAARKQHVESLIKPSLNAGHWVVSDRFTDATYAYQGGGRQIPKTQINQVETLALQGFKPDLTIWFDCDADIGLSRARARAALDRIESEAIDFFDRCRHAYGERLKEDAQRFIKIDANQNIEQVTIQLIAALEIWYDQNA